MQAAHDEQPLTCGYLVMSYLGSVDGEVFTSWLGLWMLNLPQKGSVPLAMCPVVMMLSISDRQKKKKEMRGFTVIQKTPVQSRFMKIQQVGIQKLSNSPTLRSLLPEFKKCLYNTLRHKFLGLSCTGPGVGFEDSCAFLPTLDILSL